MRRHRPKIRAAYRSYSAARASPSRRTIRCMISFSGVLVLVTGVSPVPLSRIRLVCEFALSRWGGVASESAEFPLAASQRAKHASIPYRCGNYGKDVAVHDDQIGQFTR